MKAWSKVDPQAPTPRADFIRVWINDLYYGDSKQGEGYLLRIEDNTESFCCLGRGCLLFGYKLNKITRVETLVPRQNFKVAEISNETGMLPPTIANFLRMEREGGFFTIDLNNKSPYPDIRKFVSKFIKIRAVCSSLANLNDNSVPFYIIALVIREFADRLFRNLSTEELAYIRETKLEGNHAP